MEEWYWPFSQNFIQFHYIETIPSHSIPYYFVMKSLSSDVTPHVYTPKNIISLIEHADDCVKEIHIHLPKSLPLFLLESKSLLVNLNYYSYLA